MRRFVLTWGALVILLAAWPALAGAQSPAPLRSLTNTLSRGMRNIGGASGAYVVDLNTGQVLYSSFAGTGRLPASVEKIYTTSTALLRFGPSATLTTRVFGVGTLDAQGVWHGILYLKGGGDPTFGSKAFDHLWYGGAGATMQRLVANLVRATGIKAVQGQIVGDESFFDSVRGTPGTANQPDLIDGEGILSGLAYDRGLVSTFLTAGQTRPGLYATQQFVAALRQDHVKVPAGTPVYTGSMPSGAQQLALVNSPSMAKLIQLTNTPSDNYLAEMLLKGIGARFGGAGTTAAGAAVVRAELASAFDVHPQLNDGSGLSRSDSTSPLQVVTVLRQMQSNLAFVSSLAIGGETGTLQHYTGGTAARGNCRGKTGTLHDVANLAGYCQARDGHTLAFAFLANSLLDPDYVHLIEANDMAAALAKYDG